MTLSLTENLNPLQPMEVHGVAEIHLRPLEGPTPGQVEAWEAVMLWKVYWQDL